MSESSLEIETKLVIRSPTARVVADEITQLESLGPWVFSAYEEISVRDIYVDLPELNLEAREIALRLRRAGTRHLMTLKGPETRVADVLEREELEAVWSRDILVNIRRRLDDWGIPLPPPPWSDGALPADVLDAWGLRVVQDRATSRRSMDVGPSGADEPAVAELAVDHVVFSFDRGSVGHHEVEIELYPRGTPASAADIVAHLCRRWPSLTVWPYSKYATGKVLAALLETSGPVPETDQVGDLLPAGYAALEHQLRPANG
jgi:inorganic triphosphatase YgiF